jgi:hypothetical protein
VDRLKPGQTDERELREEFGGRDANARRGSRDIALGAADVGAAP